MRLENTNSGRETNTYLTNVGRGWDGELLSVDVEGHIWHLANAVTVDNILKAEGGREESENKSHERVSKLCSIVNLTQLSCILLNVSIFDTYVSILAASSHITVDVADAALRSNNQRGASVHNSLATTIASHNLTIDGNTENNTQYSMHQTDIKHFCLQYQFGLDTFRGPVMWYV